MRGKKIDGGKGKGRQQLNHIGIINKMGDEKDHGQRQLPGAADDRMRTHWSPIAALDMTTDEDDFFL